MTEDTESLFPIEFDTAIRDAQSTYRELKYPPTDNGRLAVTTAMMVFRQCISK